MVREQVLWALAQSESGHVGIKLVIVPQDLGAENFRIVFQVPLEVRRPDVEVPEFPERDGHAPGNASVGISVLGVPKGGILNLAKLTKRYAPIHNPTCSADTSKPVGRVSSTMVKIVSPVSQRQVEAEQVDFEARAEPWATYELSDGTVLKVRTILTNVMRIEGEYDQSGNPVYVVSSQNVIQANAPKKLRGTPTLGVAPPSKPSGGGPEVR